MMKYGSIAGGEKSTVDAACRILENGGNAIDSAVGAVFTSMVSEYNLTGPGGGGAFLACPSNSNPILFDFFVDTPHFQPGKELDFFSILVDFGPSQQQFHIGQASVAVPGNTAGLLRVQQRLGRLPLKVVLEPAVDAARSGVILNAAQGYLVKILEPILTNSKAGQDLFSPDGKLLKNGDRFTNPAFADFLEMLIIDGAKYFYQGDGAELILNTVGQKGFLTKECLARYKVVERSPLKSNLMGKTIYTNPAPATGGTLITFALQLLERSKTSFKSDFRKLVRSMQITSTARREIGLSLQDQLQISQVLEPKTFNHYLDLFNSDFNSFQNEKDSFSRGSTTHVSIIDREGNAASVTTTNGEGCGYIIPELGIMLNNMLGEEDLNPLGFHQWPQAQRLPTMMAPTVIMGKKGVELVLGSGGSNRLRSAISQVILNLFIKKMDLKAAVHAARIHLEGNVLHFEPGTQLERLPDDIQLHPWNEQNLFFGGVNAVTRSDSVGDPRRGGAGIIF
jgi:gamma-glutamyltranspeptidase/glutathione hydrolase